MSFSSSHSSPTSLPQKPSTLTSTPAPSKSSSSSPPSSSLVSISIPFPLSLRLRASPSASLDTTISRVTVDGIQHVNPMSVTCKVSAPSVDLPTSQGFLCSTDSYEPSKKRSRRRTQRELQSSTEQTSVACPESTLCSLPNTDSWYERGILTIDTFRLNAKEDNEASDLQADLKKYVMGAQQTGLKGYFTKLWEDNLAEESNVVYPGVLNEPADSNVTMKSVLDKLHTIYSVGQATK
eukprot:scpid95873/ scgid9546/ 